MRLAFGSASRTFGNRFDPVYEQGYTVLCSPEGETVEVAVLLPPDENTRVDAFEPDQIFEATVTLLDFDTLYQRAVFGQAIKDSVEAEPEEEASPEVEDSVPEETTEEPEQQAPAEEPLPQEEPTAVTPEAPAEIPQATPEPAPSKPEEPAKFTITSSPSPKKEAVPPRKTTQEKPRRKRVQRKVSGRKPSRFGKGYIRFVVGLFILFIIMRSCS